MATTKTTPKKKTAARAKNVEAKAKTPSISEMPVYSIDGKKVGNVSLPEQVFGVSWKSDLVHQVTTAIQANQRQNRAHTKDRSEVSGGGKKPWKQKGTGQARHGSTRSPIWRHGGITFGPRAERNYSEKINRKMRVGALLSVLSRKAKDGEIILVNEFAFGAPKAKDARLALANIAKGADAAGLIAKKRNAALVALPAYNANVLKSFRNFGNVMTEEVRNLNPLDVLSHKYLIIENPEAAFNVLTARMPAGKRAAKSK